MNKRGFSWFEFLIVVAIIAALVGIAVPFFPNMERALFEYAPQYKEFPNDFQSSFQLKDSGNNYEYYNYVYYSSVNGSAPVIHCYNFFIRVVSFNKSIIFFRQVYSSDKCKTGSLFCEVYNSDFKKIYEGEPTKELSKLYGMALNLGYAKVKAIQEQSKKQVDDTVRKILIGPAEKTATTTN